ncbi:MAG: proline dehydrogenase family protein [Actinobacteria bacterium]|nr:proline dehydrogenase family protein [Actinomycetota bacterium]
MSRRVSPPSDPITELATEITKRGEGKQARVFRMSWWSERLLAWAMKDEAFKTQLFRFVDVFPALHEPPEVRRHVKEYFGGSDTPVIMRLAVATAGILPAGITSRVARRQISRMARQFIVGETPEEALPALRSMWVQGSAATVDLLGEKVVTEGEADRYAARVEQLIRALAEGSVSWPSRPVLEADDLGPIPRANVSIKPTALASLYAPLTRSDGLAQARERLLPILKAAADLNAFVWFDMEHYAAKDITLELFRSLMEEPALADLHAGIVIQAYLRDSHADLSDIVQWAQGRVTPPWVRLVKGAYWDAETIEAQAEGWPVPVFEDKDHTDANYERCVRLLHDSHGKVRAAFGTHNLRSLAVAIHEARTRGIPDNGYELQMLVGMAEPVQAAIREMGHRLRIYAPMGELVPGMAYLVRRLLENTSNESFVRQRFADGKELDELVRPPEITEALPGRGHVDPPAARRTRADAPAPYEPEPVAEFRETGARLRFAAAIEATAGSLGQSVPAVMGSRRIDTAEVIDSVDPASPSTVVARAARCTAEHAAEALAVGQAAQPDWAAQPAEARAEVAFGAAAWMRERRDELAALMIFEAAKPWTEADADVCEAIDFCEYYGREALRLARGGPVQSPPGESNSLHYRPKGVGVVISPWNFPLAIPTGMVVAALVAGNSVVLKPAEQTPAVALKLVEALEAGGLPPGVLGFLPGFGEEVGAPLVADPRTAFIVFTGSSPVGLQIIRTAAEVAPGQRHVKRVVAEMGGKNALIIDADADLDQAVPAIVKSSFGYAGQKCSAAARIIAHRSVHDDVVERMIGAATELRVAHPREMATQIGPVIDAEAHARIKSCIEAAHSQGEVVLARMDVPDEGWFIGPSIVVGASPRAPVNTEEIFGPVASVMRVDSFDEAMERANATAYALTAGVFSRSPSHIEVASRHLRAGNVYVNRSITGAVPGRQPFGGYGLSGVGSKAGGPDYVAQFMDPRVVTENTMRQGFAPGGPPVGRTRGI